MPPSQLQPGADVPLDDRKNDRALLLVQGLYLLILLAWSIVNARFPDALMVALVVIGVCLVSSKTRGLIKELVPFVLLLLSYEGLRRFAFTHRLGEVHIVEMIHWDKALFGGVLPTAFLQQTLGHTPYAVLIYYVSWAFYISHFISPFMMVIVLWHLRRGLQRAFLIGLLVLSYLGFIGYLLYPAAPPWLAAQVGIREASTINPLMVPPVFKLVGPNPVAAMPSLHAAYPTYIAILAVLIFGRRAAWTFLLPLGVSFATVYLGHHYVVDLIAGYLLAILVASGVWLWLRRHSKPAIELETAPVAEPAMASALADD